MIKNEDINRRLCVLENSGSSKARELEVEVGDHARRIDGLEVRFWWIFSICFVTLIGVAFNLAVSYTTLASHAGLPVDYRQYYPTP